MIKSSTLAPAYARLGVSVGASAEEVRGAFLRRLEEHQFVPPDADWEAYRDIAQDTVPAAATEETSAAPSAWVEEAWRQELDSFAGRLATLAPAERLREWQRLHQHWGDLRGARARLDWLKRALKFDLSSLKEASPQARELARHLVDGVGMSPTARAARQAEFLKSHAGAPIDRKSVV